MAVLRLFAAAREAAGTTSTEVPGQTVDEVLAAARARFGADFASVLATSRVWRNGSPASGDEPVGDGDEVAVLPPVSGGSGPGDATPGPDPADVGPRRVIRRSFAPADPPPAAAPSPRPARRAGPAATPSTQRGPRPGPAPTSARPEARPTPRQERPPAPRREQPTPRREQPTPRPEARPTPRRDQSAPRREQRPTTRRERPPAPLEPGELTRTPTIAGDPLPPSDADGPPTERRPTGRLARIRSVGVPVAGHVTIRGQRRPVAGPRPRQTELGRRYAVVYDTSGWKVTLGVAWFVAVVGAMALGWAVVAFVYAIAAGWAAMEASFRWRERGVAADPWVAALGAAAVAAAAGAGTAALGGAILLVVVAAVAHAAVTGIHREHTLSAAGNTVGCAVPFGLAAGAVVLVRDLEIGAAIVLVVFVAAYEAGDYLIGSGASNSIEGPLTGIVTIAVAAMVVAVLRVPPFHGAPVFTFAAFAAVGCPLGQLAASAILPAADAHAPAVRRLDSLLLLAPAWVWAVGVFMDSQA